MRYKNYFEFRYKFNHDNFQQLAKQKKSILT